MEKSDIEDFVRIFADPKVMASFDLASFDRKQLELWIQRNLTHQKNIRTKSSMSDFSIGRSAKRAVSSVGVKAHHSTGKIMGPPRLRDGVSCIDFSGTL